MRIIKSIVAGLLSAVFVVVVIALTISFIYEDEVSQLFVVEFNKRVNAEIETSGVNLSLLKKFPDATVVFNDFRLQKRDSLKNDTIFTMQAEHLFLQFDIIDLFLKNYSIRNVHVKNCSIEYITDRQTRLRQKQVTRNNLKLDLNEFTVEDLSYIIRSNTQNYLIKGHSDKTELNGNLTNQVFTLDISSDSYIDSIIIKDFPYFRQKSLSIEALIEVTPQKYEIREGLFSLVDIPIQLSGFFDRKTKHMDLKLKGRNLSISKLQIHIPWKIKQKLEDFTFSSGKMDLYAKITGSTANTTPHVETDLKIKGGTLQFKNPPSLKLTKTSASIYYTNGRYKRPTSSSLVITDLNTSYKQSSLEGDLSIRNFADPNIEANLNAELKLDKLKPFTDSLELQNINGTLSTRLQLSTQLDRLHRLDYLIHSKQLKGDFTLKKVQFETPDITASHINGFAYLDRALHFNSVNIRLHANSDFTFNGELAEIPRLLNHPDHPINLKGTLQSDNLYLDQLIRKQDSSRGLSLHIPQKHHIDLNLSVQNLYYDNLLFRDLAGNIHLDAQDLSMQSMVFRTLEGRARFDGSITPEKSGEVNVATQFYLKNLNIHKTFQAFHHFGQDYIRAENIKGSLTGEFVLNFRMDSSGKIAPASIYNLSDFEIFDGELIQFQPMQKLSNFIRVSELKHIYFSKLENQISIQDQKVTIPEMEIQSSALNLTLSGYHQFNSTFDYRINLLLSEILSRKADNKVHKFGTIADDGVGDTRLFLALEGDSTNSTIRYDKEGVKQKLKQDIAEEKENLKQILNEEFGLFARDSLQPINKEKEKAFEIHWEGSGKDSARTLKDQRKKGGKDDPFIIEWEEDTLSH